MRPKPNQEIFKDANYQKFIIDNYQLIQKKISPYFQKNQLNMHTTQELIKIFNLNLSDEKYLEQLLCVWSDGICTFFKHGRIFRNSETLKWFWLSPHHPLARDHNPKIESPIVFTIIH